MVERLFTLLNLLLITAFVGISVGTFYTVVTTTLEDTTGEPVKQVVRQTTRKDQPRKRGYSYYKSVAKRNIFKAGADEEIKSNTGPDIGSLEETKLQLTLWGTVAGTGEFAWAIIEEKKTRKQALYKVGDVVQNATLTHVLRNKVVLNLNGQDQVLEVEEAKGSKNPGRVAPGRYSEATPRGASKKITVERTMIDESLKDLNQLMKNVRIRPHFKDGESDGLIISGIRGDSVFKKLGLRNGDIITGVDGAKIESVDDAMKLYGGLKDMENMKVEIKRRGRSQTLDFDIK